MGMVIGIIGANGIEMIFGMTVIYQNRINFSQHVRCIFYDVRDLSSFGGGFSKCTCLSRIRKVFLTSKNNSRKTVPGIPQQVRDTKPLAILLDGLLTD